jgi:hypothetical protein
MSVFKLAARAIRLFNTHFVGINFATFHAMVNCFGTLGLVKVFISEIIVSPQAEHASNSYQKIDKETVS